MATISKFYLLDATSPNTGTLPSGAFAILPHVGAGTDATGARTARDATDVAGTSNPDMDATGTAGADVLANQSLELRRFVSRPLAARTFAAADGNWTFSYARGESNTNHNGKLFMDVYAWRPSTGLRVGGAGTNADLPGTAMAATAETTDSVTAAWGTSVTILDGDILVFEVVDFFTQGMSTAYTTFFSYNGTTEASTTTCASFVTPPVALTLIPPAPLPFPYQSVPFVPTSGGKTMHR